ncbi:MAG: MFS transporter [Clostridiales bacterium]|jgi:PPP family 3-phenylpropionic acid transporter|nr:MFS transporter [Clostridiales bacterium]
MVDAAVKKTFPFYLIVIYLSFYAAQSVYGTYLSLYFDSVGFTKTQIGLFTSVSTLAVLLTQPFWGFASDRAKNSTSVLSLLFLVCGALILGFYLTRHIAFIFFLVSAFYVCFSPIQPLMDSLSLETIEEGRSKLDFGQIRLAGTLGFAASALIAGRLMDVSYQRMFFMVCLLLLMGFAALRFAPSSAGRSIGARRQFRELLRDKKIVCFIFISLIFSIGGMTFQGYYALYFQSIGASSLQIGAMVFAATISEIPFWFIAGKMIDRFGYERMLPLSACISGLRWLLLSFFTHPLLVIGINLAQGFTYVTLNYSIVTYIDKNIPRELRATGQTMNNLVGMIVSRVIGGVAIGYLCDRFGVPRMLLASSAVVFAGTLVFVIWVKLYSKETTVKTEN